MSIFGTKGKKSPHQCSNCKSPVHFSPYQDVVACPKCNEEFVTGYESRLRAILEANTNKMPYPKYAVGRAIGYCSAIYGMATHDEDFEPTRIEKLFKSQGGQYNNAPTGDVEHINYGFSGRGLRLRNLNDTRPGFLMTAVTEDRASRARGVSFRQIYIVFRGSRSDEGAKNPMNAGFNEDGWNVDYAANFTGRQDPPWWNTKVKIRRGFLELYKSMSNEVTVELDKLLKRYPDARVIVTGHSLGAALAVVCAHHLQYHRGKSIQGGGPFCFPFCTPRVGDLQFAMDFKARLGDSEFDMPGEPNNGMYKRCMNFCMSNDPVSTQADYGYKHDRSDDLRGRGTPAANRSFVKKAIYGMTKKTDKKIIFYQTPNLYRLGYFSPAAIHQYTKMQQIFLGEALYKT
ncbi:MAG: lipase family protein [Gammaproteobacteria bacterium]|nr:lipase family protein [Gammaproteobacteria bacterium]